MKNVFQILFVSVLCWSCQEKVGPADIAKINGYWEIQKVELSDGKVKDYTVNETYDFFEIKGNKGFRQKVMPQLDGTFETNEIPEKVQVIFEGDKTYLKYETAFSKWREELQSVSDTEMVLLNSENKAYHYKKTAPINLTDHGKKIE